MECARLMFSAHALRRMFERGITVAEVRDVIANGQVIRSYPEDRPFPSDLILGDTGGRALHVVAAKDAETGVCYVITSYVPGPEEWRPDLRTRI